MNSIHTPPSPILTLPIQNRPKFLHLSLYLRLFLSTVNAHSTLFSFLSPKLKNLRDFATGNWTNQYTELTHSKREKKIVFFGRVLQKLSPLCHIYGV